MREREEICLVPLPSSAEALTASGQAGRNAGVKASCLPPLVRGTATEQVAMENWDYSARVCTGWGEYRNFFKKTFLMEYDAVSSHAHPILGGATSNPNPIPIPSSPPPSALAPAPAPPSDSYLQ